MTVHTFKKGLDLPITGEPKQEITAENGGSSFDVDTVAIVATDFIGMKPKMHCKVGDTVKRGQILFEDKTHGVRFTSPGAGEVVEINRGARRALVSVVISLNERERNGTTTADDHASFTSWKEGVTERQEVVDLLVESGMWSALRTRPFSRVPDPSGTPDALFVTAIDTRPLAASVDVVVKGREDDFNSGLKALSALSDKVHLCTAPQSSLKPNGISGVTHSTFAGPHPSGLVGTHIHTLEPVSRQKTVWHINYQDVIAIGALVQTGKIDVSRVISIAGPVVKNPRLIRTRMGAATDLLTSGETPDGLEVRVISGSVLSGRTAAGTNGYLSRYDLQLSVLSEGREREFIGWLKPGANKFSTVWAYIGGILKGKKFSFTTSTNGETRAMVPLGMYERVMPLDIMPTFLLRSLSIGDLELSEKLGALELDPEDLGLCSFVCPGKQDYGHQLSETLHQIQKEG